jgi:hypothetical protein
MSTMSFEDLESAYALLAKAIDAAGEEREAQFFTRLALLLAHDIGDIGIFRTAVEAALEELPANKPD